MRKIAWSGLLISLLLVFSLLMGCSSGGGGGKSAPKLETTSISGTVKAPSGTTVASNTGLWQHFANLLITKVRANGTEQAVTEAEVTAVNFNTNQQVGTVATTGNDGSYQISKIPKGINVLIVAEKEVGENRVHLSTLIPEVGETMQLDGAGPGEVNGATTLTALRYHQYRGNNDYKITTIDIENVLKKAKKLSKVQNGTLNLTVGSGDINTDTSGKPQINTSKLADFVNNTQIPNPGYPACADAKRMTQEVRNAGIFMNQALQQQAIKQNQTAQEIASFFENLSTEMEEIDHLITSDFMEARPGEYNLLANGDVELVEQYQNDGQFWEWKLNDTVNEGYYVSVKLTNLNNILVESTDPQTDGYDYAIDLEEAEFEYNVNDSSQSDYYYEGSLTLSNDSTDTITAEIIDEYGTIYHIIIPANPNYNLNGTFHGPESGDVSLNVALTGSAETDLTGTADLSLTGNINTDVISTNGELDISLTGDEDMSAETPDSAELSFTGLVSTDSAQFEGQFDADFVKNPYENDLLPQTIGFNGDYNDLNPQTTTWQGSLEVTADNAASYDPYSESDFPYGSVTFNGQVTHVDYPTLNLDMSANLNKNEADNSEEGSHYLEIAYSRGSRSMNGSLAVSETEDSATLTLTNEQEIEFALTEAQSEVTGSIKDSNNEEIASIDEDTFGPTIHYDDGTTETLY
ncbi:hypothetical protein [Halanaerobacter jeridensis]|uniref:Uncharacterized protein n=1 Tax=Halanaerobacter jeridensis TaxID=706427 RepID=A0A939BMC7_9FIRM|nr:hypothetical protein [Halanaerobacter jeridensis]MBM7556100.1 hypothetical protein [Halanaerobacter jeridensis]